MEPTIDIYLVREGQDPNAYKTVYLTLPVTADTPSQLGMSKSKRSDGPARFNVDLPKTPLDAVREPRVAVARLDKRAATALGLKEGFYPLTMTVDAVRKLKAQRGQ